MATAKTARTINLTGVFWLIGGALVVLKNTPVPLDIGWFGIIAFFWVPLAVLLGVYVAARLLVHGATTLLKRRLEKAKEKAREDLRVKSQDQLAARRDAQARRQDFDPFAPYTTL